MINIQKKILVSINKKKIWNRDILLEIKKKESQHEKKNLSKTKKLCWYNCKPAAPQRNRIQELCL